MKTKTPRRIGLKRDFGHQVNKAKAALVASPVVKSIHSHFKKITNKLK